MTRSEFEARKIMGAMRGLGRLPRKEKKKYKRIQKAYISAEIENGNWDAIDNWGINLQALGL